MSKVYLSTAAFFDKSGFDTAKNYFNNGLTRVELSGGTYLENQIDKINGLNMNSRPSDLKPEIYYKITELIEEN